MARCDYKEKLSNEKITDKFTSMHDILAALIRKRQLLDGNINIALLGLGQRWKTDIISFSCKRCMFS